MKIRIFIMSLICLFMVFEVSVRADTDSQKGLQFRKEGNNEMAIYYFEKAISNGETESWIFNNLASSYLETGLYGKALDCAREGFKLHPDAEELRNKIIIILSVLVKQNFDTDLDKTIFYTNEILKLDPDNFFAVHYYGLALRNSEEAWKIHKSVDVLIQAVSIDPTHEWVLHNLKNAFSFSLRRYVDDKQYKESIDVSRRIYDHFLKNKNLYNQRKLFVWDIYWVIAFPFIMKVVDEDIKIDKDFGQMLSAMEKILTVEPDNYMLKNSIGDAYSVLNEEVKGYKIREQAYDDYIRIIKPDQAPQHIQLPLKGKILNVLHVPSGEWQPYSHSGLRKHAIDLIIIDENNENIGAGKSVFVPLAGTVTRIVNNSADHSRVYFEAENGFEYYMSHFQPGSIVLTKGQHVSAGIYIGLMGKLKTMVPHLHIEFTNKYHASHPFIFDTYKTENGRIIHNKLPGKDEIFLYPVE